MLLGAGQKGAPWLHRYRHLLAKLRVTSYTTITWRRQTTVRNAARASGQGVSRVCINHITRCHDTTSTDRMSTRGKDTRILFLAPVADDSNESALGERVGRQDATKHCTVCTRTYSNGCLYMMPRWEALGILGTACLFFVDPITSPQPSANSHATSNLALGISPPREFGIILQAT